MPTKIEPTREIATQETATDFPKLQGSTRHVLLVVSGAQRNNERLHVLEFRSAKAANSAEEFLNRFSGKFIVWYITDSV